MKKIEILNNLTINKLDNETIFISNNHFNFSYTIVNTFVKDEFKNKYRYFGGLQCNYAKGSEKYKNLEKWLCEIAENLFNYIN